MPSSARSRRGQTTPYILSWIVFTTAMLVVVFITLGFLYGSVLRPPVLTPSAEGKLLTQHLMLSPNGLAYRDPHTGRTVVGTIDASYFDDSTALEERLMEAVDWSADSNRIAAEITIESDMADKSWQTVYNPESFEFLERFLDAKGASASIESNFTMAISVHHEGKTVPALAKVKVRRLLEDYEDDE